MLNGSKASATPGDLFAVLLGSSQQAPAERASAVARLLQGPAARRLQLEGPSGFTALHAAVLGGVGGAALPLLAAAGAPLNQPLSSDAWGVRGSEERAFLEWHGIQERSDGIFVALQRGYTPLAAAARSGSLEAVRTLLQLGADPEAGSHGETALAAALALAQQTFARGQHTAHTIVSLLMRAGADCLRPWAAQASTSLLLRGSGCTCRPALACMLRVLEEHRAAGRLQLGSKWRAMQLLRGAALGCCVQLAAAAIAAMERHVASGAWDAADASELAHALHTVVGGDSVRGDEPAADRAALLSALLSSSLPLQLDDISFSSHLLALAAGQEWGAALVPLLHAAGAPVTLAALLTAVERLDEQCVAALLACGCPAVDASQPTMHLVVHRWIPVCTWADPIHCLLRHASRSGEPLKATRVLERLLVAGYTPAVYRNVRRSVVLFPNAGDSPPGGFAPSAPAGTLDPFDFVAPPQGPPLVDKSLLFLARGGTWSTATHRLWPHKFKAAVRTCLLAAHRTAAHHRGGSRACGLGSLPSDVLLHALSFAALPMSPWL